MDERKILISDDLLLNTDNDCVNYQIDIRTEYYIYIPIQNLRYPQEESVINLTIDVDDSFQEFVGTHPTFFQTSTPHISSFNKNYEYKGKKEEKASRGDIHMGRSTTNMCHGSHDRENEDYKESEKNYTLRRKAFRKKYRTTTAVEVAR